MTIQRTTNKTSRKNLASNQFKFDESKGLLTLAIKCQLSDDGKRLVFSDTATKKAKSTKTDKEYTLTEFVDELGNTITLYKASLDYAPKVNSVQANNDELITENEALKSSLATALALLEKNGIKLK
jgi:hypothetical protein|nr:MAG TPA: hypothetical protein [Caudoviricetes sp.]